MRVSELPDNDKEAARRARYREMDDIELRVIDAERLESSDEGSSDEYPGLTEIDEDIRPIVRGVMDHLRDLGHSPVKVVTYDREKTDEGDTSE